MMKPFEVDARALRGLATAVAIKAAITGYLTLSGPGYALQRYVLGAAFAPRFDGQPDMALMMACLLPQLAFVFMFCDYLPSGLASQATSTMPRLAARTSWAARRTCGLVLIAVAYALAGNLAVSAILAVAGGGLSVGALRVIGCALALEALTAVLLTLLSNAVALWVDPVVAVAVVSGAHGGALVFGAFLPLSDAFALVPWLPSTRSVLAWHDVPGVAAGVSGMSLIVTCALLATQAAFAVLVVLRSVSCCDIL